MAKGTERLRRDTVALLRAEMGHRMEIFDWRPRSAAAQSQEFLLNREGMLWWALDSRYGDRERPLVSEIAADIGVNDELTRLILLGKREPSKAFLDAVGYERVVLYRRLALNKDTSHG